MEKMTIWRTSSPARRRSFAILFGGVLLAMAVVVLGRAAVPSEAEGGTLARGASANLLAAVAIAGEERAEEVGSSWPGELVSLTSVPVQPPREGMIASWSVHVGERVAMGQVIGMLSAAPAMPDALAMLAEEEKMAAMARVDAEAKRAYASERLPQLIALRESVEQSLAASEEIIGSGGASTSSFSMIEAKRAAIRAMLRGAMAKTYPIMSGQSVLPSQWTAITLRDGIGAQDSRQRDHFQMVMSTVLSDLDTPDSVPVTSGLKYFDLAIALADSSLPDGNGLTEKEITMLKDMLHKDQEAFIMAIDSLRAAELMAVDTQKMAFEQLKMIENDIAMLKQDLTMAEGDRAAKDASLLAVKHAVVGTAAIRAPERGIVSAIMKKTGEYVMPGTPVAVVTDGADSERIVRFRIPANAAKPSVGEMLSVVRTGFPDAPRSARLIGVGSALDEGGAIMADAVLLDASDWPVGAAVRVLAPSGNTPVTVKLSSLWWDASGNPNIWAVSLGGRIYAKSLTLGRTLGESVEVLAGLSRGDRYIEDATPEIVEDMLIDDIGATKRGAGDSSSDAAMRAMGM
ncbi:MAG TPA: HlyD family efflux transporter periplasmic adaptor subunit [Candidatus Paceibacterota bacterium]|nr:HlyD family efflux transporter periplasmic adaptor subunit [Candidatus Paceibacterota bacterium]